MAITDWPIHERPRDKLLAKGPSALSDAELLAIFLRTGVKGKTAVDLARDLLNEFGSLRHLLSADLKGFCAAKGLGAAKYSQLQAVLEMGRRHLFETIENNETLSNPGDTKAFLTAKMRDYPYEVFACLFLDNHHQIICFEEMFRGTINTTSVHPREVVKQSLKYNATSIIIAHNHPSGKTDASQADKQLTRKLKSALSLVDINLLDHFIVGNGEALSFAEQGLL